MSPIADRSRRPRRAENPLKVVLVVAITGLGLLGVAHVGASRVADRVVPVAAATGEIGTAEVDVLSVRRLPRTLSTITREGKVRRAIERVLPQLPAGSCATVEWGTDRLAARDETTPLVPGSAMKVITAAVALEVLGTDHRYTTEVRGTVDANGVTGNLWLVGGGDPLLVSNSYPDLEKYPTFNATSLDDLADKVVAAGVRQVNGSIVGVDTRYDQQRFVDVWPDSFHMVEAGPLGALMANDGLVVGLAQKPDDPAFSAAEQFRQLLAARGVVVTGGASHDVLPEGTTVISSIQSAIFSDVLTTILVNSDNNGAELLLKEIGFAATGVGSTANGLQVVGETLKKWGLDQGAVAVDGSGLASANRVSCSVFAALLQQLVKTLPGLLPVAAETGTLRDIFDGEAVAGRLVGKTGTLSGVKSLVGYVPVESGEPVAFTLIMNSEGIDNRSQYRPLWYRFGDALALASATPSAEQIRP